jgi:hypothetical protein
LLYCEYCQINEYSPKWPYSLYSKFAMVEPVPQEQDLIGRLLESLRELPGVHAAFDCVDSRAPDRGYDARINLHIGNQSLTILVQVKKTVYPRDVRQALWQFRELSHSAEHRQDRETQFLLIAESISPGAKESLTAERIGYFDSGGSLFLPAQNTYLYIVKPAPKSLQRSMRSVFTGRRAQVVHALLMHHWDWFGVKDIAALAKVSPSTASEVLSELDRFDWVVSRGQGPIKERHLSEPAALLDAWVKQLPLLRQPIVRRYYVPNVKTDALIERLDHAFGAHQLRYAVSYEAAAQRYAPFLSMVSQVRTRVLSIPNADAAVADMGARLVDEGSNFAIVETESAGELQFSEQVDGIWLASPVQVYLDLLRGEGRAKEMADHLRKEKIGF